MYIISLYVYVCKCFDRNCAEEWIVRRYTVFVSTWLQLSSPARRTKAPCMCILLVAPHNLPLVQRQFLPSPMKKTIYHLLPTLQKPMSHRVGNPCLRTTETITATAAQMYRLPPPRRPATSRWLAWASASWRAFSQSAWCPSTLIASGASRRCEALRARRYALSAKTLRAFLLVRT